MLDHQHAIEKAKLMIATDEARIPPPPDLDVEAHAASVLLSGALSSDGVVFDVRVRLDPFAPIMGDAVAEFREDCAVVTIGAVPVSLPDSPADQRLVAILMLASRAYAAEWSRTAAEPHWTLEVAERHIATAAISASAKAAIAAARIRLAH